MFKVLLIDDEELVRVSVRYSLEQEVPEIEIIAEAVNGRDGLIKARELKPDMILTDIRMPLMSGLEMIQAIREELPEIQFIILSGYSDFEYARQAIQYGVSDYVLKPVDGNLLRESVMNCIQRILRVKQLKPEDVSGDRVIAYLKKNYMQELSLESIAEVFNYNPKYLSEYIKKQTGLKFVAFLTALRMSRAKELLRYTKMDIREIGESIGYADAQYFARIFKKEVGCTPTKYREDQRHG